MYPIFQILSNTFKQVKSLNNFTARTLSASANDPTRMEKSKLINLNDNMYQTTLKRTFFYFYHFVKFKILHLSHDYF